MRSGRMLVLATIVLALAGSARAAPDPTAAADALLAQAKAATGGQAWDRLQGWHERGEIAHGANTVSYEAWIDPETLAMVAERTADGATVAHGANSQETWVMDPAGGVRIDTGAAARSAGFRGAYFSVFAFFEPARHPAQRVYVGQRTLGKATCDIVRVTPAGTAPMDLWIDEASHRIVAMVDPDPTHPNIALLTDFRPVGGVLAPFTVAESAGGGRTTSVEHVASYDFGPVAPSRLAPPQP